MQTTYIAADKPNQCGTGIGCLKNLAMPQAGGRFEPKIVPSEFPAMASRSPAPHIPDFLGEPAGVKCRGVAGRGKMCRDQVCFIVNTYPMPFFKVEKV